MTIKSIIPIALITVAVACNAYESKSCMSGLDRAFNSSSVLDNAVSEMDSTMLALLNSGVVTDNEVVVALSNSASMASMSLSSAAVISSLRQQGSFKQTTLVDDLVRLHFQLTFEKFTSAKNSFVKFTGSMKNPTLRNQALKVSQELDSIASLLKACQK